MEISEMSEENGDEATVLPQTYLVLQLNPETPSSALKWLVDKVRGRRRDGGAELVLLKQPILDNEVNNIQIRYNFKLGGMRGKTNDYYHDNNRLTYKNIV